MNHRAARLATEGLDGCSKLVQSHDAVTVGVEQLKHARHKRVGRVLRQLLQLLDRHAVRTVRQRSELLRGGGGSVTI